MGLSCHGLSVRRDGLLIPSGAVAVMDEEQGAAQGNDWHQDFCRGPVFFCVEEGSAGDRIGEHKVQTIPGRKGSSV